MMARIDPSFRNLIQFVPPTSEEENDNRTVEKQPQYLSHANNSGEDIKKFYESLLSEESVSKDLSSSNHTASCSSKLGQRRKSQRKDKNANLQVTSGEDVLTHSHTSYKPCIEYKGSGTISSSTAAMPEYQATSTSTNTLSSHILDPKQRQHFKLLQAAQLGDIEQVSKCLRQGLDIDFKDFYGWTPLMCAAKEGHAKMVNILLMHGADLAVRNSDGQTALLLAQISGNKEIVEELSNFRHPQITSANPERDTPASTTFYCDICKSEFLLSGKNAHETSTVHLFNTGHKPKGPSYLIPETNKGFQMLLRTGWEVDKGLGPRGEGHKYPVKTILKQDRKGLGGDASDKKKAKITHFNPNDKSAIDHNNKILQRKMTARKAAQYSVKARERKERRREQRLRFELSGGFQ